MKQPKTISESKNYKAINIGSFDHLSDYEFIHPKFRTLDKARLFIGEILQTTSSEISFRELSPMATIPFLHKHICHEEVYIILKGEGQFQVDEDTFRIKEGSIVKVSLEGSRTLCNDTKEPMIYMVVQSRADSLCKYHVSDGYRVDGEIKLNG